MKRAGGILGVSIVLALGVVPVTGCITGACPAIGYVSTLTVNLDGDLAAVSEIELCDPNGCSQPAPAPGAPVPMRTIVPTFSPETPPAPATAGFTPFHGEPTDGDTWLFTLSLGAPSDVTVRAKAADGGLLAEQDFHLVWTRVGGSERCGGPVGTPPISLTVPSRH